MICDELANGAVAQYSTVGIRQVMASQLLPLEKTAVIQDGVKLTTDVGAEVCFHLGKEYTSRFYSSPKVLTGGTNNGKLSWS